MAEAVTAVPAPHHHDEEDEAAWEGADEEDVMVLVDLPEFGGTDVFKGARSLEIRNLAGQDPKGGWRVELVLDGTRRFQGRYEDPLGTTLVVDEHGRGATGDADDGDSEGDEEEPAASPDNKGGASSSRRAVLVMATKVLSLYEVKGPEGGGGGGGGGRLAARRGGLQGAQDQQQGGGQPAEGEEDEEED